MKNSDTVLDCLYLFNQSNHHRRYSLLEFNWYLIYPLLHDKICVLYRDNPPVALFTWCWLDEDKAERFLNGKYHLTEYDYTLDTGDQLWGVELIAPFGDVRPTINTIKTTFRGLYGRNTPVHWRRSHTPNKLLKRKI